MENYKRIFNEASDLESEEGLGPWEGSPMIEPSIIRELKELLKFIHESGGASTAVSNTLEQIVLRYEKRGLYGPGE